MDIEERLYQYAVPKKYTGQTPNAQYKVDSEWHKYYSVDEHKNYFIEDELEFLRQLRQDLIEYQMLVDQKIEKVKKREVKL
jgi:hypothetical protein